MVKKNALMMDEKFKTELADRLASSRKYKKVDLPRETLLDLIEKSMQTHSSSKDIEEVVRRKLHNLVAPYLGDPDYSQLRAMLPPLPASVDSSQVRQFCAQLLNTHASTRERVPINEEFYQRIFALTGVPAAILDLACGLNPFALPWMHLPPGSQYLAYDLHQPRVELINTFFKQVGQNGAAIQQDILVAPPQMYADVIFFFKEAHRFEQREPGSVRAFLEQLKAKYILLSLPTETLTGRRSMLDQDRRLVNVACAGQPWSIDELVFSSEIVFCIQKEV